MRPVTLTELGLLARVLMAVHKCDQPVLARRILAETEGAAQHLYQTGRAHPQFGDGSLMARCLVLSPMPEPVATDAFLSALITACCALRSHSKS